MPETFTEVLEKLERDCREHAALRARYIINNRVDDAVLDELIKINNFIQEGHHKLLNLHKDAKWPDDNRFRAAR